jgi:purine-binding chemotaxis protein CheW
MEATKQVVFKLGQEEYGLDILIVNAIETYSGVVSVPNAPDYILGMLNIRGEVIPVFSLRIKFGLPEATLDKEQLIITRTKDMVVGFKVDAVCGILEFDPKEINEVPLIVRSERTKYAKQVANKDGKMILLLDHEGILDAKEKGSLQDALTQQD